MTDAQAVQDPAHKCYSYKQAVNRVQPARVLQCRRNVGIHQLGVHQSNYQEEEGGHESRAANY